MRLLVTIRKKPKRRLSNGFRLYSLFVTFKPNFSKPSPMIKIITPVFRYGSKFMRKEMISPIDMVGSTD